METKAPFSFGSIHLLVEVFRVSSTLSRECNYQQPWLPKSWEILLEMYAFLKLDGELLHTTGTRNHDLDARVQIVRFVRTSHES